jgi:predicted TIM-barrel fold metal-dependent hydrolase
VIRDYHVIDFHIHTADLRHCNPWVTDFFNNANKFYLENLHEIITPNGVIDYLNSEGVDLAVTLAEYNPHSSGVVPNEFLHEFCAGHSDRLIPMGSIDFESDVPYIEQAKNAVYNLGMKGFKLLPSYAYFYPNDPKMFPMYGFAQELGLPIMFHTGTSVFTGTRIKYANPLLLDDVACEFPELKLLLEHGGRSFWYDRVAWMLMRHPNVYVGCAGIPAKHLHANFKLEVYSDRFIFGSDWPGVVGINILACKIMDLPISREVKEKIFYHNAARVLGIKA